MTLPAFDLHDAKHSLAVNGEPLHPQTRRNYSIAEIRLGIDHVLGALRNNFDDISFRARVLQYDVLRATFRSRETL